ncbi:MAG: hypothetical protein FWH52_03240 [Synergistaceae bacterium]|nr:hypothetical protein [Synergistaceae bacterium]
MNPNIDETFDFVKSENSAKAISAIADGFRKESKKIKAAIDDSATWWKGNSRNGFVRRANEIVSLLDEAASIVQESSDKLLDIARIKKEDEKSIEAYIANIAYDDMKPPAKLNLISMLGAGTAAGAAGAAVIGTAGGPALDKAMTFEGMSPSLSKTATPPIALSKDQEGKATPKYQGILSQNLIQPLNGDMRIDLELYEVDRAIAELNTADSYSWERIEAWLKTEPETLGDQRLVALTMLFLEMDNSEDLEKFISYGYKYLKWRDPWSTMYGNYADCDCVQTGTMKAITALAEEIAVLVATNTCWAQWGVSEDMIKKGDKYIERMQILHVLSMKESIKYTFLYKKIFEYPSTRPSVVSIQHDKNSKITDIFVADSIFVDKPNMGSPL